MATHQPQNHHFENFEQIQNGGNSNSGIQVQSRSPINTSIKPTPTPELCHTSPSRANCNRTNEMNPCQPSNPPSPPEAPSRKTGSRRIFAPAFKIQVLDSYRFDDDCKGNQRATARKYGIHRRQIQKWLQLETNLRNSLIKVTKSVEKVRGNVQKMDDVRLSVVKVPAYVKSEPELTTVPYTDRIVNMTCNMASNVPHQTLPLVSHMSNLNDTPTNAPVQYGEYNANYYFHPITLSNAPVKLLATDLYRPQRLQYRETNEYDQSAIDESKYNVDRVHADPDAPIDLSTKHVKSETYEITGVRSEAMDTHVESHHTKMEIVQRPECVKHVNDAATSRCDDVWDLSIKQKTETKKPKLFRPYLDDDDDDGDKKCDFLSNPNTMMLRVTCDMSRVTSTDYDCDRVNDKIVRSPFSDDVPKSVSPFSDAPSWYSHSHSPVYSTHSPNYYVSQAHGFYPHVDGYDAYGKTYFVLDNSCHSPDYRVTSTTDDCSRYCLDLKMETFWDASSSSSSGKCAVYPRAYTCKT